MGASLQWQAPANNGGAAITAYVLTYNGAAATLGVTTAATVGGLTPGGEYVFTLQAVNSAGLGAAATAAASLPAVAPSAPQSLVAVGTGKRHEFSISWSAPAANGGAAILRYELSFALATQTDTPQSLTVVEAATTSLVAVNSSILPGNEYIIYVRAVNAANLAGASASVAALSYTRPGAPANLSVVGGDGQLALSWGQAAANGASVTAYVVYVNGLASATLGGLALAATAEGLSNGEAYTLGVAAANVAGVGATAVVTATPLAAPSAPQSLTASAFVSGLGASLSWSAPAESGGAAVTGYVLSYGAQAINLGATLAATVGGLTAGGEYVFTLRAANSVGLGLPAAAAVSLPNAPSAPRSLTAADGDGEIVLQWQAPERANGSPVLRYVVEYTGGAALSISAGLAATLSVANGAPITILLYAVNHVGTGAAAMATATAATTPGAPTGLQAQDGDGVITLQWSAPANGGAAITGYVVEYTGGTQTVAAAANPLATLSATNGEEIVMSVYALNRKGSGLASAPATATAATTPGAPTGLQAAEGDGVVTLTWGAPASDGGATVTAYLAEWNGQSSLLSDGSLVVSGLTNGETASFTVRAQNRKGSGLAALTLAAGRGKPSAPQGVVAAGANGTIAVSWGAPANDNGASVTGYIVSYKGTMTTTAGRGFTLSGLSPGETVNFTVQAVNSVGVSDGTTAQGIARDAPSAPTNLTVVRGNGVATITWGAPAQLNGATLQGYGIVYGGETQSVGSDVFGYTATGLSNGVEYEFRVFAYSDQGNGAAALSAVTPATTPGAPDNLRAAFADEEITLQWDLVVGVANGGAAVTAYIVRYGSNEALTVGAVGVAVVDNLTNGETVAFSVYAVNAVGAGALPATVSEYANTTPGAPTGLQAQDGNGVITLQWVAPGEDGGAAITAYAVEYTGGTITASSNRATLTGLSNGAAITASVYAVNRGGRGAASAPVVATAATTPGAPTGLQAQDGNGVITAQWTAPSEDGGAALTGYSVEYTGGATMVAGRSAVLSVSNGAAITLTVYALNRKGAGAASAPATATAATTPGAPTSLRASVGSGEIVLQWGAPASDGGAALTAYFVEYNGGAPVAAGATAATISGLTNGETVVFSVYAQNRKGAGARSSIVAAAEGVAGAPGNFAAAAGNAVVTLTWAAAEDNGAPVTAYILLERGASVNLGAAARAYTVSGLVNGVIHRFTLRADNSVGMGAATVASATPHARPPDAPQSLVATAGDGRIELTWNAPNNNGGSAISAYIVYVNSAAALTTTATAATLTTGINNGTQYVLQVRASNYRGESQNSNAAGATPKGAPLAPGSFTATGGNASVVLTWTAANNNGAALTRYDLLYLGQTDTINAAATAHTLTGLANNTMVAFTLRAVNSEGEGAVALATAEVHADAPGKVEGLTASAGNRRITLQWNAPDDGGATIAYVVSVNGAASLTTSATGATLTSLTNGDDYTIVVAARNYRHTGAASDSATARPLAAPSAPRNFAAEGGNAEITLSWNAPTDTGGATVFYALTYPGETVTINGAAASHTVSGLVNNETVAFTLWAVNITGTSGPVTASATPHADAPSAPGNFVASRGDGVITLSWSASTDNGGADIVYVVSVNGAASLTLTNAAATGATLTGLTNGTTYSIVVAAVNYRHTTAAAAQTAKPAAAPGAPGSFAAEGQHEAIVLTWSAAAANGEPILRYLLTRNGGAAQTLLAAALAHTVSGLTNGTTYNFTLWAVNAVGGGAVAAVAGTPLGAPGAPPSFAAAAGNGQAVLTWGAAADNGANVTGYIVTYSGQIHRLAAVARSHTATGLTNGVAYSFTARAANSEGEGAAATAAATPQADLPDAPGNLNATAGDGRITLTWNAPANNGGSAISAYIVYVNNTAALTTAATAATLTAGIANGTAYTLWARASNYVGEGANSNSATVTPKGAPLAPGGFTATGGNASVVLTWTAANANGAALTRYDLLYLGRTNTINAAATGHTLTGLANNTTVAFTLRAVNSVGEGAIALATAEVHADAPGKVEGLTANAGDEEIVLQWNAPDDGGATIAYVVSVNGAATLTTSARGATLTSLTNGDAYTIVVAARNYRHTGAGSDSTVATPLAAPDAPDNFVATGGNAEVILTWDAPTDNGGATVFYVLTYSGETVTINGAATSHTVTGLVNNAPVAFVLRAVNTAGSSANRAASATPHADAPSAPGNFVANRGDGVITLSWSASTDNGGADIVYVVSVNGTAFLTLTNAAATAATLTGLTNGTTYSIVVAAANYLHTTAAAAATAKPAAVPGAPGSFAAEGQHEAIVLSWSAATANGEPILRYLLTRNGGTAQTLLAAAVDHTVSGLTNGTTYNFTLWAVNAVGGGAVAAVAGAPLGAPGAPPTFAAVAGNGQAVLTWGEAADNGANVTGYIVTYSGQTYRLNANARGYTATGLTNGTAYSFTVRAANSEGEGAAATAATTPQAVAPGAPGNFNATAGDGRIELTWNAPANNGGAAISAYIVYVNNTAALTTSARVATLTAGINNGTAYTLWARASNYVGEGANSNSATVTPKGAPLAPGNFTATGGNASVVLSWTAASNNGAALTGYKLSYLGGTYSNIPAAATGWTLTGLANNSTIAFTLLAVNSVGDGAAATAIAEIHADAPDKVEGLNANAGDEEIALQWSAPSNGGAAITAYIVYVNGTAAHTTSATVATLTGLTNGSAYTIGVEARNYRATGAISDTATATPLAAPSAPRSFTAEGGNAEATLTWNAPADNGGATVFYVLTYNGETVTINGEATSHTVTGLTNSVTVAFTLRAVNITGTSGLVSDSVAPHADAPGKPTGLTATPGNGQITLSWQPPTSDGGAPIEYIVYVNGAPTLTTSATGATANGANQRHNLHR